MICILGRTLKGEEAPLASQLNNWLDAHPGWEVIEESDDDEDDEEQEDDDGSNQKIKKTSIEKGVDEKEPIKKAKMEDDEYRNTSEEHTYYRLDSFQQKKYKFIISLIIITLYFVYSIAHTIHESVTEQASILVNGNLKEYQIKVIVTIVMYAIRNS